MSRRTGGARLSPTNTTPSVSTGSGGRLGHPPDRSTHRREARFFAPATFAEPLSGPVQAALLLSKDLPLVVNRLEFVGELLP
jgi:hypothetical protein